MSQMETVAGDTTIAHATAYATIMEALAGTEAPLRAQWLRAIALELERLANHTGDLGALANDVAFLPTASACGKIRGDFLNLTALHLRQPFWARPRAARRLPSRSRNRARGTVARATSKSALAEVEQALAWFWDATSVRARFECTGTVSRRAGHRNRAGRPGRARVRPGARRAVRSSGGLASLRAGAGGRLAGRRCFCPRPRALRWKSSAPANIFGNNSPRPPKANCAPNSAPPAPDTLAVALVEGWRGEVCHVALTDDAGQFRRYKIVDPSFHNWIGLALALRGQAISDFPICNKSFNLSYCGFDL